MSYVAARRPVRYPSPSRRLRNTPAPTKPVRPVPNNITLVGSGAVVTEKHGLNDADPPTTLLGSSSSILREQPPDEVVALNVLALTVPALSDWTCSRCPSAAICANVPPV